MEFLDSQPAAVSKLIDLIEKQYIKYDINTIILRKYQIWGMIYFTQLIFKNFEIEMITYVDMTES